MGQNIDKDEIEIDLGELFHVLLGKWWLLLLSICLGGALALGITLGFMTPQYESRAMLYILSKTTSVTSLADIQLGTALTADFEVIAMSKPVLDGAIENIRTDQGLSYTRKQLESMLTISNQSDTRILVITAKSSDPQEACIVANAVANNTANQMAAIMKSDPPTTVEAAEVSTEPVSPSKVKNTLIGGMLGLLLAAGILILRFMINDNIQTEEDVTHYLGLNTLVSIPLEKQDRNKKKKELQQMEDRE
ncbi:MAG: Wzz/FepE/Etk N-terminal domain-containing protein [Lachnospiraceae bacterium]|nr:Wzz/FepE/Etk N-terminal domain-containing protein [Lachnospiraceae bacterium]